jgi:hypothetical protein
MLDMVDAGPDEGYEAKGGNCGRRPFDPLSDECCALYDFVVNITRKPN